MHRPSSAGIPPASRALMLLLGINLFNYIDRSILAALEPEIEHHFFGPGHAALAMAEMGGLSSAFMISYMITAPLFGWLADRVSRWWLIGAGVALWSAASAGSGLALTFTILMATRMFVGIGEAAYGPTAPTILSDLYPIERRGSILSYFYMAIPVGSAIGYAMGGLMGGKLGWRWPFYAVAPPGILLALACFFMPEPRRGLTDPAGNSRHRATMADYLHLFRIPSYLLNTLAMAAMTFAIGGLSYWAPKYIADYRHQGPSGKVIFGIVTAAAGLIATLFGGWMGDALRKRYAGAYFLVSGVGMLIAFPFSVLMLYTPFPAAWVLIFLAVFFLFFNTGPSNTALANVTHPSVRSSAFALNILIIHLIGDVPSPPLIGAIAGRYQMNTAFLAVSAMMLVAGLIWLFAMRFLPADEAAAIGAA